MFLPIKQNVDIKAQGLHNALHTNYKKMAIWPKRRIAESGYARGIGNYTNLFVTIGAKNLFLFLIRFQPNFMIS